MAYWALILLLCLPPVCGRAASPLSWLPHRLTRGGGGGTATGPFDRSPLPASLARQVQGESSEAKRQSREQEQLYEAYNMLHSLAQDFHKPFDAPAVLVVGHQTSGKSALIEALMGFQFNQVGGGTKTRRPIALRMQYNASCDVPRCFLTLENGVEELKSLGDIQAYIENENLKLERDPNRCYDSREINIRMEYRYCPNMILIDTPGMIHAPKGNRLSSQQRALAHASKEAEELVLEKMKCEDYIILCVEDTTDWKHATTRNVVMQADPSLSRTVLVTTKFDTKLSQFSEGSDLSNFIRAPLIDSLFPQLYGGPFYTSVPTGRVGLDKEYSSNHDFVEAIKSSERNDKEQILMRVKVGSSSSPPSSQSSLMNNVGISRLRSYLEARVDDCYRRNVAKIVPQLQSEYRRAEEQLTAMDEEIASLSLDSLRQGANVYREAFAKELSDVIHGTAKASPDEWGETLDTEQVAGGGFLDSNAGAAQSDAWRRIVNAEVGNGQHKLFGGAQYHRALREFVTAVKHMNAVVVTEDEIANAAGVGDMHDGVNFLRAACVLALNKAQATFDPMLQSLQYRCKHIMHRLYPVVDKLISDDMNQKAGRMAISPLSKSQSFKAVVRQIYNKFIDEQMDWCLDKCKDDLRGMTRFVTWDVDGKGGSSSLYNSLPTPKSMVEIYNVAVESKSAEAERKRGSLLWGWRRKFNSNSPESAGESRMFSDWRTAAVRENSFNNEDHTRSGRQLVEHNDNTAVSEYYDLLHLMDEMISKRSEKRTSSVVTALVQYIIRTWREHFAKSVSQKFNCFFLLPFIDEFPVYLRTELDKLYANEGNSHFAQDLFDVIETKNNLLDIRDNLTAECEANKALQARFDKINAQLNSPPGQVKRGSYISRDNFDSESNT